jgi:hypothetical protein
VLAPDHRVLHRTRSEQRHLRAGFIALDPNDTRFKDLDTRSGSAELKLANVDLNAPVIRGTETVVKEANTLWKIFFLGFLGGLVACSRLVCSP